MAFDDRSLDSYVDVAQRIADFREMYPHGSLQPLHLAEPWTVTTLEGTGKDGKPFKATFIVYTAAAYRDPDDGKPGVGCAYEVFPGRTPYTAGSELQNAETAAWGRAIIAALASDSKRGVASREEIRNRAAERPDPTAAAARSGPGTGSLTAPPAEPPSPTSGTNGEPEVDEHGAATFAEQTRMVTGPVPGTERLSGTPPDDEWLAADANGERKPGKLPKPVGEQPPKPARGYTGVIQAHFKRLGVDDRDHRLAATGILAGRTDVLASTRDLTPDELKTVADLLSRCRDHGALIALLADREPAMDP
jgi:hypothetical protein